MTTFTSSLRRVSASLFVLGSLALTSAAQGQSQITSLEIDPASLKLFNDCNTDNTYFGTTNSYPGVGNDFFLATFNEMSIELANTNGSRRGSKDCVLEFDVELPEGYTVGTFSFDPKIFMDLPDRARGTAEVIVSIPGLTNRPWNDSKRAQVDKVGPYSDTIFENYKFDFGSQPGQLCPKKVRVYVDVLAWAKIDKRAAPGAEASMDFKRISGLFQGSGFPIINVVECKKDTKPWWWF